MAGLSITRLCYSPDAIRPMIIVGCYSTNAGVDVLGCLWNEAARRAEPPRLDRQDQDRQSEKLRIARHLVELLREAEVSCELADPDTLTTALPPVKPR
jgi:hypothetical protein